MSIRHKSELMLTTPDARNIYITPRDFDVLRTINDTRLIEMRQLAQLHFGGSTLAQRRLSDLKDLGLLRRITHRRLLRNHGRGRYSTHVLYALTQTGKELIGTESQDYRVPQGQGVEMHLRFMQLAIDAHLRGIPWKYRHQLEEEYVKAYYVPLRGMFGGVLLYCARWARHVSNIYEHYVTYCAVRGEHSAIVVADNAQIRRMFLDEYPGGPIRVISPDEMSLIPVIATDPSFFLRTLLDRNNVAISPGRSSHVIDGDTLYAELVTGDLAAAHALHKWPPERSHVLATPGQDIPPGCNVCLYEVQP